MTLSDDEHAKSVNDDFNTLRGIEFLRKLIRDGDQTPIAKTMGMKMVAVEDGSSTIEVTPGVKFYNPMMRVHGGFAATVLDTALGTAVMTLLPAGVGVGTIVLNVNYVRKIEVATGPMCATGKVLHRGKTMLTAEAELTDKSGKLYAHATGTFLVYPK